MLHLGNIHAIKTLKDKIISNCIKIQIAWDKVVANSVRMESASVMRYFWVSCIIAFVTFDIVSGNVVASCQLSCPFNSTCVNQTVNHLAKFFDNKTNTSLTWSGFHCDCPTGLTGLVCEVAYESCKDGQHICYNEGRCISGQIDYFGNEQMFCDCSRAVDVAQGLMYVGKYCEHAVLVSSNRDIDEKEYLSGSDFAGSLCPDNTDHFCVNGGTCNRNYPSTGGPCVCDTAFSGPRCEYATTTVPNCSLPCKNGGCVLGPNSRTSILPWWQNATIDINNDGRNDLNQMHCDCASGYDGPLCDIPREVCETSSDQSFCYHGGKCNKQDVSTCACLDGYTGTSCEYAVVATNDGNNTKAVNNATFGVTEVGDFRGTDEPWDPSPCSLNCMHGQCVKGQKNVSDYFGQVIEHTQHIYEDTKEEQFMHCSCQESWTGPLCDIPMEACENETDFCLHGGTCLNEFKHPICNCTGSGDYSTGAPYFAGQHCEHQVHDVCTKDAISAHGIPLSYCVNGGLCKSHVTVGEPHPGCNCAKDFIGPHCELRESVHVKNSELPRSWNSAFDTSGASNNTFHHEMSLRTTRVVVAISILFLLALVCLFLRYRRLQHQQKHVSIDWINKYRDHAIDSAGMNIAPRRESASDYTVNRALSQSEASIRDSIAAQIPTYVDKCSEIIVRERTDAIDPDNIDTDNPDTVGSRAISRTIPKDGIIKEKKTSKKRNKVNELQLYLGPPRDEDGHVLHNVDIL